MNNFDTIDAYVASFPPERQRTILQMRGIIHQAAPEAEEAISYGIPTFKLNGNLFHFAIAKNHLGFYTGPSTIKAFPGELAAFKTSKGTIRFPLDKPLPEDLIARIVTLRVKENKEIFTGLSAPARRALRNNHIDSVKQLADYSEQDLLKLHGLGPASIPLLRKALKEIGLSFKLKI